MLLIVQLLPEPGGVGPVILKTALEDGLPALHLLMGGVQHAAADAQRLQIRISAAQLARQPLGGGIEALQLLVGLMQVR